LGCRASGHLRPPLPSIALDDDLGLAQSVENFAVEQLITKAGIEALDVAILPGTAALDVGVFNSLRVKRQIIPQSAP
jgi:hypothetical protein